MYSTSDFANALRTYGHAADEVKIKRKWICLLPVSRTIVFENTEPFNLCRPYQQPENIRDTQVLLYIHYLPDMAQLTAVETRVIVPERALEVDDNKDVCISQRACKGCCHWSSATVWFCLRWWAVRYDVYASSQDHIWLIRTIARVIAHR